MKQSSRIILFTLIIEGILIGAFAIWARWRNIPFPEPISFDNVLHGIGAALPLLVINFLLFGIAAEKFPQLSRCRSFRDEVLIPLAEQLTLPGMAIVSIAAGIGEELFFRYLLQSELGIILSSLLFAFLHFGPVVRDYYFIASLYFIYGLYFGSVFAFSDNIWVPIVAHALYDFLALIYLRRRRAA